MPDNSNTTEELQATPQKQYAKIVTSTGGTRSLVFPTSSEFPGVVNWWDNDLELRAKNYLPLVGEAEPREGYYPSPLTFHIEVKTRTVMEDHQEVVDDYDDEEHVIGHHTEFISDEVTYDDSYIQIDSWQYTPAPVPPPPPTPVKVYSKLKIAKRLVEAGLYDILWNSLTHEQQIFYNDSVDFKSDNIDFMNGLALFKAAFPAIDADAILEECIADK